MSHTETHSITLKMLIDAGILKAGVRLHAESDENMIAILSPDGNILLSINGKTIEKQSLSGAARAITGKSVNGWLFWSISESGEMQTLSFFRSKYQ